MGNNHNQKYFSSRFSEDQKRKKAWKYLTNYLQRYVSESDSILELGAGYSYFINEIRAKSKYSIDLFEDLGKFSSPDVEFHVGDVTNLSFLKDSSVDVFFASNLFEHLDRQQLELMLQEIDRVGSPNFRVIVIQPNYRLCSKRYFDDYTHVTIFTDISMRDWMQSHGYRCLVSKPKFLPLTVKSRLSLFTNLIPLYIRFPIRPLAGQMLLIFSKNSKII
jgi:ubiquinone/menaquinone biosynthesis C-methylase UbiE